MRQQRYYVIDGLGHVRALLNSSGVPTDLYHYDSWGNPIPTGVETTRQPFRWNGAYGYEYIPFTGLYHIGAREYDPRTARWLQRDPIDAASGDPNLYRYCGNDPINFTDVDGADKEEKQPNNSASKKAEEKTQEKVAFICVGNTDMGWFDNSLLAVRHFFELRILRAMLERQGYTVIADYDCTREEALAALKDERTVVFVFYGHANTNVLETADGKLLYPDDVRNALSGRRMERIELWGCYTESDEWRKAFGNPNHFDGSRGLYYPVTGIDGGNLTGKKPEKPKDKPHKKKLQRAGTAQKRA